MRLFRDVLPQGSSVAGSGEEKAGLPSCSPARSNSATDLLDLSLSEVRDKDTAGAVKQLAAARGPVRSGR